jgi:hypothetical protein
MSNTRFFTATIAFIVTFIFSAGLVRLIFGTPEVAPVSYHRTQCFNRQSNMIESFIRQDIRNGETRMDKIARRGGMSITPSSIYFADFSKAVTEYSNESGGMDASRLPADLQTAWREHMKAWRDFAEFLAAVKDNGPANRMDTEDFKYAERGYNQEINRTWENVLSTGRSYGANVY